MGPRADGAPPAHDIPMGWGARARMLVTNEPIRVDVPNEPGQWIEIRKLSWKALKDARKVRSTENLEVIKILGGEFVKAMQEGDDEEERRVRARLRDLEYDRSNFDADTLLEKSLCAWSYPPEVTERDLLDEPTAMWAVDEIIRISRPPTEADAKNA